MNSRLSTRHSQRGRTGTFTPEITSQTTLAALRHPQSISRNDPQHFPISTSRDFQLPISLSKPQPSLTMALYSPIPPPTPRIIITEPTEHDPSHVKWNRNFLTAIWIPQFLCLLFGMGVLPFHVADIVSFQFLYLSPNSPQYDNI